MKINLESINKQIANCKKCDGLNNPKMSPSAPGYGLPGAKLMVIGQCLHAYNPETDPQIPFVGPIKHMDSGLILFQAIKEAGFDPLGKKDIFITNIVHCHCPGHRRPTTTEIQNCKPFLEQEISIVKPNFLLLLGSIAIRQFVKEPPKRIVGIKKKYICAIHPSYIRRQNDPYLEGSYIKRLSDLIKETVK